MRALFFAATLAATAPTWGQTSSDYIRTPDGALIRAGDAKTEVLAKLGFPDMQQGGTFYYRIDGRLYQIKFSGDDTVSWIKRSRD